MKIALVLGGADCMQGDMAEYLDGERPYHGVVACNDAIGWYRDLIAGVTLHPEYLERWLDIRKQKSWQNPALYAHKVYHRKPLDEVILTDYNFPGQTESMTSGVMAAKVALIDLGFDRVVFCGVPMTNTPHFVHRPNAPTWDIADHYFERWYMIPKYYKDRMRSMSGRTRELLGAPDKEFLYG